MDHKHRLQRSVWVLDINDYILYLEDCLYRISPKFPWLLDSQPIDRNWTWRHTDRFTVDKTQRDYLIDWIIKHFLREVYYFDTGNDWNEDFHDVFNVLCSDYALHESTKYYLSIPHVYGDIFTPQVFRQSCWVYIEADIDPQQQKIPITHALPKPITSA